MHAAAISNDDGGVHGVHGVHGGRAAGAGDDVKCVKH